MMIAESTSARGPIDLVKWSSVSLFISYHCCWILNCYAYFESACGNPWKWQLLMAVKRPDAPILRLYQQISNCTLNKWPGVTISLQTDGLGHPNPLTPKPTPNTQTNTKSIESEAEPTKFFIGKLEEITCCLYPNTDHTSATMYIIRLWEISFGIFSPFWTLITSVEETIKYRCTKRQRLLSN